MMETTHSDIPGSHLIDEDRLAIILELYDRQRRTELFRLFREQAVTGLKALRRGFASRDSEAMEKAAHRLASTAANLACAGLHGAASRIAHPKAPRSWEVIEQELACLEALLPPTLLLLGERLGFAPP